MSESLLPLPFYSRDTITVAENLLGKVLVRTTDEGSRTGLVVETEAYRGRDDPASHSYLGLTKRNEVMFGRAGVAYVYFTYGNHYCLNVVTETEGTPGAVLIRAIEPLSGVDIMMKRRNMVEKANLASGPGKLTKAFSITKEQNGLDLTLGKALFLTRLRNNPKFDIAQSRRVGIKRGLEKPWRFIIKGNSFVSKRS